MMRQTAKSSGRQFKIKSAFKPLPLSNYWPGAAGAAVSCDIIMALWVDMSLHFENL